MDTLIRSVRHIERHLEQWARSAGAPPPLAGLARNTAGSRPPSNPCDRCAYRRAFDGHPAGLSAMPGGDWLDRQGVMDYLRISDRTYYRLKADGTLRPHRFGRRDYYFRADLEGAYRESIRRGRV